MRCYFCYTWYPSLHLGSLVFITWVGKNRQTALQDVKIVISYFPSMTPKSKIHVLALILQFPLIYVT